MNEKTDPHDPHDPEETQDSKATSEPRLEVNQYIVNVYTFLASVVFSDVLDIQLDVQSRMRNSTAPALLNE